MEHPAIALTQYPTYYEQPVIPVPNYGSTQTSKLAMTGNAPTPATLTFCNALTGHELTPEQADIRVTIATCCPLGGWGFAGVCGAIPECIALPGPMVMMLGIAGVMSMVAGHLICMGVLCQRRLESNPIPAN